MGLADHLVKLDDVEPEDDGFWDDYYKEPADRFWGEFPDGEVPVRAVYQPTCIYDIEVEKGHSPLRRRFFAWAEVVTRLPETIRHLVSKPIIAIETAREQFVNSVPSEWATRRECVVAMMQSGLTLRQIARYAETHPAAVVRSLMRHHENEVEQILDADELLRDHGMPAAQEATGLSARTLQTLESCWSALGPPCPCGCGRNVPVPTRSGGRQRLYAAESCRKAALRARRSA